MGRTRPKRRITVEQAKEEIGAEYARRIDDGDIRRLWKQFFGDEPKWVDDDPKHETMLEVEE